MANAVVFPSGWCTYCDNDPDSIYLGFGKTCPKCGCDYTEISRLQDEIAGLEEDLGRAQDEHSEEVYKLNALIVSQQDRIDELELQVLQLGDAR